MVISKFHSLCVVFSIVLWDNDLKKARDELEKRDKIYWHEPFYEGLQLDLNNYRDYLQYENEHPLSKEALIVDVVVVKNEKNVKISNSIGKTFRKHNLIEFKSEKDSLSIWDYEKVLGYAHLYSAFEKIPQTDISVTFVVTMYPRELIKALKNKYELTVQYKGDGIYYIEGAAFSVQILESKKLTDENIFIKNLRSGLSSDESAHLTVAYKKIRPLDKRNVYLDSVIQANLSAFKEAMKVSDIVKELFFEVANEDGWLESDRKEAVTEELKKVAKNLLLLGRPTDEVTKATGLPIDIVESLA